MGGPAGNPYRRIMSTSSLAYDDAVTLAEMAGDARAAGHHLALPRQLGAARDESDHAAPGTPQISDSVASHAAELELHYA